MRLYDITYVEQWSSLSHTLSRNLEDFTLVISFSPDTELRSLLRYDLEITCPENMNILLLKDLVVNSDKSHNPERLKVSRELTPDLSDVMFCSTRTVLVLTHQIEIRVKELAVPFL